MATKFEMAKKLKSLESQLTRYRRLDVEHQDLRLKLHMTQIALGDSGKAVGELRARVDELESRVSSQLSQDADRKNLWEKLLEAHRMNDRMKNEIHGLRTELIRRNTEEQGSK